MQQLVRKMAFKMKQNNIFLPACYSPLDRVIYESNVKILLQSASLIPIQLFRQCQLLFKKKYKCIRSVCLLIYFHYLDLNQSESQAKTGISQGDGQHMPFGFFFVCSWNSENSYWGEI
eukprot:TRINITY_DN1546_c2_g1_i1.p1 TRINITY_DN1546_c2_g1~~TRINITY_DN1546_c2_g1_i1.p1  ORF type:complete len:118 (+),score=5.56 TRINITY_DN1546_c2_g1_i1:190-543(+)